MGPPKWAIPETRGLCVPSVSASLSCGTIVSPGELLPMRGGPAT